MKPGGGRRKGKQFERDVAIAFRAVFPNAQRTLSQQRDSGEAPDVGVPGYWLEAKNHHRVNIQAALLQAVEEEAKHRTLMEKHQGHGKGRAVPVAVTKDFRAEPLVTLLLTDFLGILSRLEEVTIEPANPRAEVTVEEMP